MKSSHKGIYSTLLPVYSNQEINMIKTLFPNKSDITLLDTTGNVGGESMSWSKNLRFSQITTLEINPETFKILEHNLETFDINNVKAINIDCFEYIQKVSKRFTFVYCDPPWDGSKKSNECPDLFLTSNNEQRSVFDLIRLVFRNNISDIFILKTPPQMIMKSIKSALEKIKIFIQCAPILNKKGSIDYKLYIIRKGARSAEEISTTISFNYTEKKSDPIQLHDMIRKFIFKCCRPIPGHIMNRLINKIFYQKNDNIESVIMSKSTYVTLSNILNQYIAKKSNHDNKGRTTSRINDIKYHIKHLKQHGPYLDVGCSEGCLTSCIGNYLELEKTDIHGCDIIPEVNDDMRQFNYKIAPAESLPYKSNQFNIVSMMMSLHHVDDIEKALREIYRVLKPGGIFLIREHNCKTEEFRLFLIFVHYMYSVVINNEVPLEDAFGRNKKIIQRIIGRYQSKKKWNKQITAAGFVKTKYIIPKYKDMFRSYYALYQKL
jgi:ubiquinone/menaquinone biosynthesis C-methylase UbiE/16S rRNA G966 N2-methylase RsmD